MLLVAPARLLMLAFMLIMALVIALLLTVKYAMYPVDSDFTGRNDC